MPSNIKIATIVGARPQFIKAAAVSRAIAARNGRVAALPSNANLESGTLNVEHRTLNVPITEVIIHTGQHYDEGMSAVFFRELEIPEPVYNIGIGSGLHGKQTGDMLASIEKLLIAEKPDGVLVYGDTNSTLAGTLAAAKLHIPVAHVEAGLRSFNRRMPEEINRVVTDHLSTLLFCPSQVSVDNLTTEGITNGVTIVGDVMADALQFTAEKVSTNSDILKRLDLQPKSYLMATVHRAENTDDPERLENIMGALADLAKREPVILPLHPRTKKILQNTFPALLNPNASLRIIDPVGYFDIIALGRSAHMILTDSGGMQKEAYWLKVPCITLRDETEWVETVKAGWNILSGADQKKIINAVHNFTAPTEHPSLYGDGHAAEKITKIIGDRLEAR